MRPARNNESTTIIAQIRSGNKGGPAGTVISKAGTCRYMPSKYRFFDRGLEEKAKLGAKPPPKESQGWGRGIEYVLRSHRHPVQEMEGKIAVLFLFLFF